MDYPRINIIYDDRRIEKYPLVLEELMRQDITWFRIWSAVTDNKTVVESINSSHKKIVWDAKVNNQKECCIMEDDCFFPNEKGFEWFLKNKPESFDIYSAANYNSFKREGEVGAVKTDTIVGFHLYIISERHYDKFLSTAYNKHIDTEQNGELYFCYPFAALQRPGFSYNNMAICNYNAQLKPEDIYS